MTIHELRKQFEDWKKTQGISRNTERNYRLAWDHIVAAWNKSLGGKNPKDADWDDIQLVLNLLYQSIVSKEKPKEGYPEGYTHFNAIKGLLKQVFRYIDKSDIANKIGSTRLEQGDFTSLSLQQVQNILKMLPYIHEKELERIRNSKSRKILFEFDKDLCRQIILVGFSTGLRASELIKLRVSDINFTHGFGKVSGKGRRKQRDIFYFLFNTNKELAEWVKRKQLKTQDIIFKRVNGKVFGYWQLWNLFSILSDYTDTHIRPHTLRHSVALYMINNGFNPAEVQKFLCHRSIQTTSRYIAASSDRLLEQLKKVKHVSL